MVYGCIVMYMATMLGPPVISWFISPSNYSYKYIPWTIVIGVINQLSYLGGPTLYLSSVSRRLGFPHPIPIRASPQGPWQPCAGPGTLITSGNLDLKWIGFSAKKNTSTNPAGATCPGPSMDGFSWCFSNFSMCSVLIPKSKWADPWYYMSKPSISTVTKSNEQSYRSTFEFGNNYPLVN